MTKIRCKECSKPFSNKISPWEIDTGVICLGCWNKKQAMSNSTQNIKEWAGDPMHPRDSTQNDEIEVDGETYVKWDTQNDIPKWSKRLQEAYDKGYEKGLVDARREEIERMIERLRKPIQWIVGDDTGASSKVIWSVIMGVEPTWESVPYDEADYGRCVRLLRFIPEWQSRLNEVVDRYPNWKEATKHILATLRKEDK